MTASRRRRALAALTAAAAAVLTLEGLCRLGGSWREVGESSPPWESFLGAQRHFPKSAPPDDPKRKIVCVGGSTTAGYPYPNAGFPEWLGHELERCALGGSYRVLQRGAGGYGSRRTLAVLREALEEDPWSVVILSGHNEISEEGVYRAIPGMLLGGAARAAHSTALGTRISRLLWRTSRALRAPAGLGGPLGLPMELKWPAREEAAAAFEARLREMIRACRSRGVRAIVVTTPVDPRFPPSANVQSLLSKRIEDPREADRWARAYWEALRLHEADAPEKALAALDAFPDKARVRHVHWLAGTCAQKLGRSSAARESFKRALEDESFLVASAAIREAQRRAAREEGALLVDLESVWKAGVPEGYPPSELFADNHHLSGLGYRRTARRILAALSREGALPGACPAAWDGRVEGMLQRDLGLDPGYDAAVAGLQAKQFTLYGESAFEAGFHRMAVDRLVFGLKRDRAGTLDKLMTDRPFAAINLSMAFKRLGDDPAARDWREKAKRSPGLSTRLEQYPPSPWREEALGLLR